jgi:hypothetical protein
MSLPADLDAFCTEHRRCGDLGGGVEGDRVSRIVLEHVGP